MKYRNLGRTGVQVSEIGFGCWAIGGRSYGQVRDEDSLRALETAWDAGVNFFDTADTYGEGHSETLLAKFLKGKPREKVVLATKVGWDFYLPDQKPQHSLTEFSSKPNHAGHRKNFDPAYVHFACEQSLRRLGVGTIDLYQLHNPSLDLIRAGELTGILGDLKKEGKIRFSGVSVHTEAEALAAMEDPRVDVLQIILNVLDQRMALRVLPQAEKNNIGILAREPLASGLLTGKYDPTHEFPKDDHRRRWFPEKRELDWQKIRKVRQALAGRDIPLPQAALEYILAFRAVSSVIPGAKTATQVQANLKASVNPGIGTADILRMKELYEKDDVFKQGLIPR